MNKNILDQAVQVYINANLNADVNQIALSKNLFENISQAVLAGQITAKKKSEKKLPTWFNAANIYYPSPLSIEQTSSEITARHKAKLAKGNTLIDLTGGFGVDAFFFAKEIKEVTHCEINEDLSAIAAHNAKVLSANNIVFKAVDGLEFLKNINQPFDNIYIDPARRAEKGKVFMLKDCTPDVISNLDLILSKSKRIIIKTAPLLDLTAGLKELGNVSEIHIISLKNECKEILWIIDKDFAGETKITASTLNEEVKNFSFYKSESVVEIAFAKEILIGQYLYEPDAALLKSGAFNLIAERYKLTKLHPQTQLYTAVEINHEFPGRIFKIEEIYSSSPLKKMQNLTGNVIVRNYPAKAEDLVKKFKIKADQEKFLIFSKTASGENIIISAKIIQYY
ncbi:THUMP-like domain-containing protein [Pedobacter nototheniae]|uniref:THUMP-like domain-containing protein n=1 Tax=Pedobacter nototheniae TaxID=2488994 RepID=UPI002931EF47|nr:hypothetical protein [Pedobacter nototheniae]